MNNIENNSNKDIKRLLQAINESAAIIDKNYIISPEDVGNDSFVKKAFKRIIRKMIGWYIDPVLSKQTLNNSELLHIIQNVLPLITSLNKDNIELKNEILNFKGYIDFLKKNPDNGTDLKPLENCHIDYFDYENHFRGSREVIKEYQQYYIKYYQTLQEGFVLDIGCGRGEFMELLQENGITVKGIDYYHPFVDFCRQRNLQVEYSDALTYLTNLEDESLNGIFMSQVIEHLSQEYAVSLIRTAYKKLIKGSYFILETPNPQNLSTYWNFYLDFSHIKPVHYLFLEYLFNSCQYESVEKYHSEFSKCDFQIPYIESNNINNLEEINKSIDYINNRVFGYYDYTLIAKK